ncbi:co-chaperone GroES [Succinispira mobilis]|uniref:co-chaperone GroES n=1 Tax=Succinispira mobilis TaxID=78120 RepID=UPI000362D04C|nr:co-chaperone GroES [Succinispira mobilis]
MLKPLADKIIIQVVAKEEVTKSGIVLPGTAQEKPQEGVVIAVGAGRILDNGSRVTPDVKVNDKVVFAKYSGTEFKCNNQEYLIVSEKDILAVIQ